MGTSKIALGVAPIQTRRYQGMTIPEGGTLERVRYSRMQVFFVAFVLGKVFSEKSGKILVINYVLKKGSAVTVLRVKSGRRTCKLAITILLDL